MQDTYSSAKCARYGQRLAAHLSQRYFETQPTARLDGPALLTFTPVRQVNLLVLRQLLSRWQQQAKALRSPYFDFEAPPVQAAHNQLLNVLSRHIALGREALEPLLAQAVTDTLRLAADPAAAFAALLLADENDDNAVALAQLRELPRYLDQARPFFEGFLADLPDEQALDRIALTRRFGQYRAANQRRLPTVAQVVAALSPLLPLTEADLWDDGPAAAKTSPALDPEAQPTAAVLPTAAPAAHSLAPQPEALEPLLPQATPVLPAPPAAPPVNALREAISINQRFSFINELFEGENMEYHAFVQQLDGQPSADAALALVRQQQAARPEWTRKEEHVAKLLKLLERRFADA